jgi:hypothetical protein
MKLNTSSYGPWALAIAAVLSHQAAHAQAYSSAGIDHYQYTLTDLDPNDGIAPSITWGKSLVTQKLSGSVSDGVGAGGGPNAIASRNTESAVTLAIDTPRSMAFQGFGVSSGPTGLMASASVQAGGTWWLRSSVTNDFVLSSNTAVTFTALANEAYGVVVPEWSVVTRPNGYQDNGYFDWAPIQVSASAMLHIGGTAGVNSSPLGCTGCLAVDQSALYGRSYASVSDAKSKLLTVTYANNTTSKLASQLSADAITEGYATAPVMMVPELASSAQMLLGLAGLGAVLRFGRRQKAA